MIFSKSHKNYDEEEEEVKNVQNQKVCGCFQGVLKQMTQKVHSKVLSKKKAYLSYEF